MKIEHFFSAFLYGPERGEIFACKARGTYSRKVAFFRNDSRVYIVVTVRGISLRPSLTRNCISWLYPVGTCFCVLRVSENRSAARKTCASDANARPGLEILRNIKTTDVCELPRRNEA